MKAKNKSAYLQKNNDGMYRITKLQNCIFVLIGRQRLGVDSLLTEKEAEELSQDRTIEVTIKGMKE